jgi:hypothetical protein
VLPLGNARIRSVENLNYPERQLASREGQRILARELPQRDAVV